MNQEICCPKCNSLNCNLSYSKPFMCATEGEYHFTCKDCKRNFYGGIKKYKDIKQYE